VRRFQVRHGLHSDGIVHDTTLRALNVPAEIRLQQLKINATRLKALTGNLGNRIVVANIPAAQIEAIENGVAVTRHTAVAGKPDRPSPDINSKIIQINFNPFWTVPVSIVRKDLIPKMQAEPDYLTKNHIRIYDAKNNVAPPSQIDWYSTEAVNYKFKQDAGNFNSLGSIRINFPSQFGVYMHDTPSKNLFGEDFRFASSGCMRVQNVCELVYWILQESPGWSRTEIDQVIASGERKDAKVKGRAAVLGLCHGLGHARRRRAIPRRHLQSRRLWCAGQCGEGVGAFAWRYSAGSCERVSRCSTRSLR